MTILHTRKDIPWCPTPNTVSLKLIDELPDMELISSAYVFAFDENKKLLLADLNRGWDIPGGHMDPGETPEDTARRETREETGVDVGALMLFGCMSITIDAQKPETYKYPHPTSIMPYYFTTEIVLGEFTEDEDSFGRGFFSMEDLKGQGLVKRMHPIAEHAFSLLK